MCQATARHALAANLNESPSEKEGKSELVLGVHPLGTTSMKVPPKRKGNAHHHSRREP